MAITVDDDGVIFKDGNPIVFPRDGNYDPAAFLVGFDSTETLRFASFKADGRLRVDAAVTIDNVDIGDVNIRVKDTTEADILVSGGTNPDATTRFLYNQDQRMTFLTVPGPLNTNVVDRVAREVGRVLGSDVIYVSETFATTDVDTNARPTNGDFVTRRFKTKQLVIKNTGSNIARITVSGSVDNASLFDVLVSSNTLLSAGSVLVINEESAFTHIRIVARSNAAGQSTTIITKGYALGT